MSPHDHSSEHGDHSPTDPDALEPGEPHSPIWLPFLGIGLFLLGIGVFLATRDADPTHAGGTSATTTATEAGK